MASAFTPAAASDTPPSVNDLLQGLSNQLAEIRKENAEVLRRAQRVDTLCNEFQASLVHVGRQVVLEQQQKEAAAGARAAGVASSMTAASAVQEQQPEPKQVLQQTTTPSASPQVTMIPPSTVDTTTTAAQSRTRDPATKRTTETVAVKHPTPRKKGGKKKRLPVVSPISVTSEIEPKRDDNHVNQQQRTQVHPRAIVPREHHDHQQQQQQQHHHQEQQQQGPTMTASSPRAATISAATPHPLVSLLGDMGYQRATVEEAIDALGGTGIDIQSVIDWIAAKEVERRCDQGTSMSNADREREQELLAQQRWKEAKEREQQQQRRLQEEEEREAKEKKEREAKEKKEAKERKERERKERERREAKERKERERKEAEERKRQEQEEAERRAREADERARREAKEVKDRLRREEEERERMEMEQKKQREAELSKFEQGAKAATAAAESKAEAAAPTSKTSSVFKSLFGSLTSKKSSDASLPQEDTLAMYTQKARDGSLAEVSEAAGGKLATYLYPVRRDEDSSVPVPSPERLGVTRKSTPSYEDRYSVSLLTPDELRSRKVKPFLPRAQTDFDDGGAYPECHVPQYPRQMGKTNNVSPIFGYLQDASKLYIARELLVLEGEISDLKKEAGKLDRFKNEALRNAAELVEEEAILDDQLKAQLARIDKGLKTAKRTAENCQNQLKKIVGGWEWELERLKTAPKTKKNEEREQSILKWLEGIERQKQEKDNAPRLRKEAKENMSRERQRLKGEIEDLNEDAHELNLQLQDKLSHIEEERNRIAQIKRNGEAEDERFNINGLRDEYDRTFLMVAVQNEDEDTAELCLRVGANPDERNAAGQTAMFFAKYFGLERMANLVKEHGGNAPGVEVWDGILSAGNIDRHPVGWDTQLRIAEKAVIPADTQLASAEALELDEKWRMEYIMPEDRQRDFSCYDATLIDPTATNFRRVVLLEKDVFRWLQQAETGTRSDFRRFLQRLKPEDSRREGLKPVICHRRAIVGVKKPFEVVCAAIDTRSPVDATVAKDAFVVIYSPFVESEINGVSNVGVLVWSVTTEEQASLVKALIEESEFKRNKVDYPDDRFPAHKDAVLELGKDMHLIDLKTTSIFTGGAMELFTFDVDGGELGNLMADDFIPTKRLLHHEQQLKEAIFSSSEKESRENQGILSNARTDMSTNLFGAAGTGKTLLMIKKLVSESVDKRFLFVSRLSRLVSMVKSAVEAERDASNVVFSTYDDVLTQLARRVMPSEESDRRKFSVFTQVHFGETTGTGAASSVSFVMDFFDGYLEEGERETLKRNLIEPITLWGAFRIIKSNVRCSETLSHLSREEYVGLPRSFGLSAEQRNLVYNMYVRYEEWLQFETMKWDEADRVLYVMRYGGSVFCERNFVSWEERAFRWGEMDLVGENDLPVPPFFYHMTFLDEAQDFSDLDLALFIRMTSGVRSLFLGADPAQSVEVGVRMRAGTVNDVFHTCLPSDKSIQVKNVLQDIQMKTNHRTHAQNLEIARAIRRILTRSFGVPGSDENALMNGPIPEALLLESANELADGQCFRGGNIVFITPDEMLADLRSTFLDLGIKNDAFGVREAKGLEFPSVALVGFFSYFEKLGNSRQWENVIRWLFSSKGITKTESAEKVDGSTLENCDYILSSPEIEDQAMMLYTAMTRPRERLYLIEINEKGNRKKGQGGLAEFAFRQFKRLDLLKLVNSVDEGEAEMTPQQHKARGVLLVTQAIDLSRNQGSTDIVKDKFLDAASRFKPDKGNDKDLLEQTMKHLDAILMKRSLMNTVKSKFFDKAKGESRLQGHFNDILEFERGAAEFFRMCAYDSFLADEIHELRVLIEETFYGTPYESHFAEICEKVKEFEG